MVKEDSSARKRAEIAHGRHIADRAACVWNWASPAGRMRAEARADLLADGFSPRERLIELGAGTGEFTRRLAARGLRVTATDLSEDLLRRSPGRLRVVADAERLPFRHGAFDGAVGSSILHHLDLEAAWNEVRRVLAPGGRFRFAEPNMANPQILLQKNIPWLKRALGDTPGETAYFRFLLARFLRAHGAREVRIVPYDFLHPWTPRPLLRLAARLSRILERMPLVREIAGSLYISGRV